MHNKILRYFLMILMTMVMSVPFVHAQDSDTPQRQDKYDFIIDEALDNVEEGIERVQNGDASFEILKTKIIPLLHAEASGIVDTLDQMKSPKGEVIYNREDGTLILKDVSKQLEAMSAYVKEVDILLETKTFELEYAKAENIVEEVKEILTKHVGQAQFDKKMNSIVATDTPLKIGKIENFISSLDFINKEIQIETKILQIMLNDEHVEGVDWEAIVSDFQAVDFSGFIIEEDSQQVRKINVGSVSQEDYTILLEALDTVGVVHNVSNDIVTMKNEGSETIRIASTLSREIQELKLSPADDSGVNAGKAVQFHLSSIIDPDEKITVFIEPVYVDKNTDHLDRESYAQTSIQIGDGETIVIGSLFESVMVESMRKIPLLGDLPLLGFVFRNQGEESRKSEIITFLTVKTVEKED